METVALNFDYMRHKMLPLGEALGIATTRERRGFQDSQRCSRQPSTCRHITRFYPALFKWKKFCYTYSIIDTCRFILLSTVFSTNYPHLWTGSSSSRKKRKKKNNNEGRALIYTKIHEKACTERILDLWLLQDLTGCLQRKKKKPTTISTSPPGITDVNAINSTNSQTLYVDLTKIRCTPKSRSQLRLNLE